MKFSSSVLPIIEPTQPLQDSEGLLPCRSTRIINSAGLAFCTESWRWVYFQWIQQRAKDPADERQAGPWGEKSAGTASESERTSRCIVSRSSGHLVKKKGRLVMAKTMRAADRRKMTSGRRRGEHVEKLRRRQERAPAATARHLLKGERFALVAGVDVLAQLRAAPPCPSLGHPVEEQTAASRPHRTCRVHHHRRRRDSRQRWHPATSRMELGQAPSD